MPRRLTDLTPEVLGTSTTGAQGLDEQRRDTRRWLEELDSCLEDARYTFAHGTLEGIRETVSRTQQVTSEQRRAILNIRWSVESREDRRSSSTPSGPDRGRGTLGGRRYEGFEERGGGYSRWNRDR